MEQDPLVALIAPHLAEMVRIAAALVGEADAEDAAQEALEHAWTARASLRDPQAARPWLLQITVNVCRNWWSGRYGTHRRLRADLATADTSDFATLDPGSSAGTAALDLRQALNALDASARLIVVLRYYAGLDATEIGAALQIPPATVRTRLRRALERLRGSLATDFIAEKGEHHA